ncbi:MAG: hypothetical protein LBU22_11660 [Dysgonamonadaceae bacterium]|jgi:hypothetical protein|nr:hypothetical protein [Dysgonamonadaceae bacterium]
MKISSKISFLFICLVMGLTSCLNEDDANNIVYFYDEPAIFVPDGEKPFINTAYEIFYVPDLVGNTTLKEGDLLWTSFIVDTSKPSVSHSDSEYYATIGFKYKPVDSASVMVPEANAEFEAYLSDDYSETFHSAVLYRSSIDKILFFGFKQAEKADDDAYIYEMVMNPKIEDSNGYPSLYIRAKKSDSESASRWKDEIIFAFKMDAFVNYYKDNVSHTGPVKFNLKYKIGTDNDGKDVYRGFMSNPLSWNVTGDS